jgi:uncharacterized coiled-coil DUF342 family protein
MPKRTAWREQERQLVERWSAATERYRAIHEALAARRPARDSGAPDDGLEQKAREALDEIETLRRQVARMKREFLSGERY